MSLLHSDANHMGIKLVLWGIYFVGVTAKMGAKYSTQSAALNVLPFVSYSHNPSY
jgi:hypothetical protein